MTGDDSAGLDATQYIGHWIVPVQCRRQLRRLCTGEEENKPKKKDWYLFALCLWQHSVTIWKRPSFRDLGGRSFTT